MCCISLKMYFLLPLLKFKILIITVPRYWLLILLVLNTVFMPLFHVKAVQDDIPAKSVPI